MLDIFNMLKNQLDKMDLNGSWYAGVVTAAVSIVFPAWIAEKEWTFQHEVLLFILIGLFVAEWIVGRRLTKLSPVKLKNSKDGMDSLIRDMFILFLCGIAYAFDFLIGSTGSFIYVLFTGAFIYHNLYSLLANIEVLGWGDYFPMWLMRWLDDEIKAKTEKYFPKKTEKDDEK